MKQDLMGNGAGLGNHNTNSKRVFTWLWHAWLEAQRESPLLRWLGVAALVACGLVVYRAASEGKTFLDAAIYGGVVVLFALAVPVIYYLLFEIYRRHRSDAIFDSRRLADHIRKIAIEEIEANNVAKLLQENNLVLLQPMSEARTVVHRKNDFE